MIAVNNKSESLPVLQTDTVHSFQVDGTAAHAESGKLPVGIYRIAVRTSVNDLGVMIMITAMGTLATTTTGMYMAQGVSEYFGIEDNDIISVIDGKINVTKVY
jgi:hypothetical protein